MRVKGFCQKRTETGIRRQINYKIDMPQILFRGDRKYIVRNILLTNSS